jgi:hypothetical protein
MHLFNALHSEFVKSKRTSVWYLALIASVVAPIFTYLTQTSVYKIADLQQDPWNMFLMGMGGLAFNIMVLPFFLMLTCTFLGQMEHKNNTWKQVYVSPQPLFYIYLSKFLVIQMLLLGVVVLSNALLFVWLYFVDNFEVDLHLTQHQLNWQAYLVFTARIYVTVLAISAMQLWLSLRFKNFIVPILIGLALWFVGISMTEEHPWKHDDKYPYIYPMRNFFPVRKTDRIRILWGSAGYTLVFFALGYYDFANRRNKL